MAFLVLLLAGSWLLIYSFSSDFKPREKVTLALPLHPSSALNYIAIEKGFFAAAGLDVLIKEYPSGASALRDFQLGSADLVSSADVPVVVGVMSGDDLRILAAISVSGSESQIVARKDRGILRPGDLKHKKIGTQKLSAVHYFLDLFLLFNQISVSDVDILYFKPEELPMALARGEIDAFSMREPYVEQAKKLLGDGVITFGRRGIYERRELMVAHRIFVGTEPRVVEKFLRGLIMAAEFVRDEPEEAAAIVGRKLKVDHDSIAGIWPTMKLDVNLDQSLLVLMEEEAHWMINNRLVSGQIVPNFADMIDIQHLERIDRSRVTVVH